MFVLDSRLVIEGTRDGRPGDHHRRACMKQKLTTLSERYVSELRKHLQPGSRASLPEALSLGRQAVALGLETLELARMHERALVTLKPKDGLVKRAEKFFTEANTPIVET